MPTQNDPGQQTPIRQNAYQPPDPKSAARTPSPLDDVTPPADVNKGRNGIEPATNPLKGI
jgi:hypothetical protein